LLGVACKLPEYDALLSGLLQRTAIVAYKIKLKKSFKKPLWPSWSYCLHGKQQWCHDSNDQSSEQLVDGLEHVCYRNRYRNRAYQW